MTIYSLPGAVKQNIRGYPAAVLGTPGLEAFWPLQEPSGTSFAELLKGFNAAPSAGASITPGHAGPCPSLSNSIGIASGWLTAGGFVRSSVVSCSSIMWFKTTSTNSMRLFGSRSGASLSICALMGVDGLGAGGAGKLHFQADANSIANGCYTTGTFNDGTWHFYAGTQLGFTGFATPPFNYKVYIDGVQVPLAYSSLAYQYTPPWTSGNMVLTANGDGGAQPFIGNVAGMAVFSRQLTLADIQRIYRAAMG